MSDMISVDYNQLSGVAQQFEQESMRVKKLMNDIDAQINTLRRGGWIADAATRFYQEMDNEVMPGVSRLQQALNQAASTCRDIATTMDDADQEACSCLPNE
jgi:WXG100 family type VII secretion target